jgi:hypothetical protein
LDEALGLIAARSRPLADRLDIVDLALETMLVVERQEQTMPYLLDLAW